jgi:DNA-binding MarR family transcriptional regulator
MGRTMSSKPLPGSSRDERPNIGILFRDLHHEVVRRVTSGLAEAGFDDIRPAHTAVFQHIAANGSRLTDLADRAQITKQSMGYLVDYLEECGYVERRPDPTDRRVTLICLTDRGWDEIRTALALIATVEAEWTRRLGKGRMEELRVALGELREGDMLAARDDERDHSRRAGTGSRGGSRGRRRADL